MKLSAGQRYYERVSRRVARYLLALGLAVASVVSLNKEVIAQEGVVLADETVQDSESEPKVKAPTVSSTLPTTAEAFAQSLPQSTSPTGEPGQPFVPEGDFETTLFDIYLGGKFKGAVLADYTDSWLSISDPEVVLEQLAELKAGKDLVALLLGPIEGRREVAGLGTISYELNTFRILIDVDPKFLSASSLTLTKLQPDPDAAFTLQQRAGVTAAGTVDKDLNSAISHRSIASLGRYFAIVDGAVVSNQPYEITDAKVGGIFGDYRVSTGLLQANGNAFASSLQFAGVGAETAQELFLDQDLIRGSRFEVFVPSRSRVEFYRDARLIAVQSLDFGLREIDTTAFPQGSYDVDIVITDTFGTVTRERKFFTKSGYLASETRPTFFLQVGSIRNNLDLESEAIYQTGFRWRAADIFDLGGSVYGSSETSIGSIETNLLYRSVRLAGSFVGSSDNDAGVSGSIGASIFGFNFDAGYADTLRGGTEEEPLPEPDPDDPFAPVFEFRSPRDQVTFQDRTLKSGSIARSFGRLDLRFAGEETRGNGSPNRKRYGPSAEVRLVERQTSSLRLQGSRFKTDDDTLSSVGLLYGYRFGNDWSLSTQLSQRDQDGGPETVFLLSLNYDGKRIGNVGTRASIRNELQSKRPDGGGGDDLAVANQLDVDHTGDYMQTIGFLRDTQTDDGNNTAIGGSAIGTFLISSDGAASIGRPVSQEAVFIAELPSTSTASEFDVLLNGQVVGTVKAGGSSVIGVNPYKKYSIQIRPQAGSDLVEYDSKITHATFFPGNVIRRVFVVEKVFIALGRIVDQNGHPLARQRIKGPKDYTVTEEDGTFQAEISGKESLRIDNSLHRCDLQFRVEGEPEYIVQVGDVTCLQQDDSNLSAE